MLLHTQASTHRCFYTQMLQHTEALTQRHFYTHTSAFTCRPFYTQTILHTDAFMRKPFYTQKLSPQFLTLDHHFARKGCASTSEIATSPQLTFLTPSFRAKGLRANLRNRNFTARLDIKTYESEQPAANAMLSCKRYTMLPYSFWRSNLISRKRVVAAHSKSQFNLRKFLAIEPHFVRKSCRGTLKITI